MAVQQDAYLALFNLTVAVAYVRKTEQYRAFA